MVAAQAAPGIVSPVTEVISALKSCRRSLPYGPAGRADASEFAIPLSRFTTLVQQATLPDLSGGTGAGRRGCLGVDNNVGLRAVDHVDRRPFCFRQSRICSMPCSRGRLATIAAEAVAAFLRK